ncbi:hypothetical protein [Actinoplanes sp. NPDC051494]|uniref:hypothetical protein n=1 Tax=Actinoplanes sp. NPDC051494 TaxID=3363907 RepID=UPI0037BBEA69
MTNTRATPAERPERPTPPHHRPTLPGWAIAVIVVCAIGGVTIAAHYLGVEADALAKVIYAVAALVTALGLGLGAVGAGAAVRRRRRSRKRRGS